MRPFKVAYGILTLNFFIPAVSYVVAPEMTYATIDQVNRLLGGGPYPGVESGGHLWHMLGTGNVFTLALMCGLLWWDVTKYRAILPALLFLKGFSAVYALFIGAAHGIPFFYGVFALDGVSCFVMWFFATRALRTTEAPAAPGLPVPA